MADSDRLTVLKRLTALLEGTPLDSYPGIELPSTLAGVVFRGRGVFGDSDPDTMLSILEAPRNGGTANAGSGEARKEFWQLLVQGWCPEDRANPSDPVYGMLDAVERRFDRVTRVTTLGEPKYPEHYLLGAGMNGEKYLIAGFQMTPGTVRPPTPNISSKCWFYVPIQVELVRVMP